MVIYPYVSSLLDKADTVVKTMEAIVDDLFYTYLNSAPYCS